MIRKISLIAFALTFASADCLANGYYLGAGLGPEGADFTQNVRIIVQPPGSTSPNADVKDSTHHSGTGLFGTVFGGYQYTRDAYYLAGEANFSATNLEFNSSNTELLTGTTSHTTYKLQTTYGFSLLPGYAYSDDTLFYARIGYANGQFKINTTDSSLASVRRNLNGIRFGLGARRSFTEHISARMEYSQVNYQTAKFWVLADNAVTKSTQIEPTTGQVEFGLVYSF